MKRAISNSIILAIFAVGCVAPQAIEAQQAAPTAPKPDNLTQTTVPPIVSPNQAVPERTSSMLTPIESTPQIISPDSNPLVPIQSKQPEAQSNPLVPLAIDSTQPNSAPAKSAEPQSQSSTMPAQSAPVMRSRAGIPLYEEGAGIHSMPNIVNSANQNPPMPAEAMQAYANQPQQSQLSPPPIYQSTGHPAPPTMPMQSRQHSQMPRIIQAAPGPAMQPAQMQSQQTRAQQPYAAQAQPYPTQIQPATAQSQANSGFTKNPLYYRQMERNQRAAQTLPPITSVQTATTQSPMPTAAAQTQYQDSQPVQYAQRTEQFVPRADQTQQPLPQIVAPSMMRPPMAEASTTENIPVAQNHSQPPVVQPPTEVAPEYAQNAAVDAPITNETGPAQANQTVPVVPAHAATSPYHEHAYQAEVVDAADQTGQYVEQAVAQPMHPNTNENRVETMQASNVDSQPGDQQVAQTSEPMAQDMESTQRTVEAAVVENDTTYANPVMPVQADQPAAFDSQQLEQRMMENAALIENEVAEAVQSDPRMMEHPALSNGAQAQGPETRVAALQGSDAPSQPPIVDSPPANDLFPRQALPAESSIDPIPDEFLQTPIVQDGPAGTNDYFVPSPLRPGGCNNPNCQGCNGAMSDEALANQCLCSGSVPCARSYLLIDALYLTRADGDIQGSTFFALSDFNGKGGLRFTFGRRFDQSHGREITYWGSDTISEFGQLSDPAGRMGPNFITGGAFSPAVETSSFQFGVFQAQEKKSRIHNISLNRTCFAWDVLKSNWGFRYIYLDDEYNFATENFFGETGLFSLRGKNNLFGYQFGSELFYDIGYRLSFSGFFNGGGYLNFGELKTYLENNGFPFINRTADKVTWAWELEFGMIAHYQLTQRARLRFGYNLMFLWNVITTEFNFPRVMSQATGADPIRNDDAVIFHGLNIGFEFYR